MMASIGPNMDIYSYWQKGCDDAKKGLKPQFPFPSIGLMCRENQGYMNGYDFGRIQIIEGVSNEHKF